MTAQPTPPLPPRVTPPPSPATPPSANEAVAAWRPATPHASPPVEPRTPTPEPAPAWPRAAAPEGRPTTPPATPAAPAAAGWGVRPSDVAAGRASRTPSDAPGIGQPSSGSAAQDAAAPRRPINPFLANDPHQKARRLARALVSDMVAYHPQQREQALRDGSLRQLFRDEIKKSYEEYVDQVGREFADGTAHFQDALNEILANGQQVF